MRRLAALVVLGLALVPAALRAQDTSGVRVVLQYTPGSRPGLVIVPGAGLDSVRAILRRDLDYSDRFEVVVVPAADDRARAGVSAGGTFNYALWKSFGASFALELIDRAPQLELRVHDLNGSRLLGSTTLALSPPTAPTFRFEVHRLADEIVRWVTGTPGIAATRLAFTEGGRVKRVDADGYDVQTISPAGVTALSPTWAPDGRRLAYTALTTGRGAIQVLDLAAGTSKTVPGTSSALNITPAFAPDGKTLAFAHSDENGTQLTTANVVDMCCERRLTVGKFSDNLSPTFAPDGRRLAFVSTRAGPPQIYVMAADGTDTELLVPFDLGTTGQSQAPEWSPDGASVVFHRDVSGSSQIFVFDVGSGRTRQLTSSGRNEDPTWAPDGRHIAFVSDRSGRRQLWVIDLETSRVRPIASPGAARLPAWSRRLR